MALKIEYQYNIEELNKTPLYSSINDEISNKLKLNEIEIKEVFYKTNKDSSIATVITVLKQEPVTGYEACIVYTASPDNKAKFRIKNGLLKGEHLILNTQTDYWKKRSRKPISSELIEKEIVEIISNMDSDYKDLETSLNRLSTYEITKSEISSMFGDLVLNKNLFETEQVSALMKQLQKPDVIYSTVDNHYSFYMICSAILFNSNPRNLIENCEKLNYYLTSSLKALPVEAEYSKYPESETSLSDLAGLSSYVTDHSDVDMCLKKEAISEKVTASFTPDFEIDTEETLF